MRSRNLLGFISFLLAAILLGQTVAAQDDANQSKLSRKTIQQLEETVLPAYEAGDIDGFLKALAPLIDKLDVAEYDALDAYGKTKNIESIRGTFARLVLESVEQGRHLDLDITKPDRALFLMTGMADHINAELSEISSAPEMASQIDSPDEWVERERIYWNIHVTRNRFMNLERLAKYVGDLAKAQLNKRINYQDPNRKETLEKFAVLPQEVQTRFLKLLNNEAMMRLDEFLLAEDVLQHTLNFEERMYAAYALEDDGRTVLEFLEKTPAGQIAFEPLKKEDLREQVNQLLASGRESGKDVIEKALLLRSGTHWWLRGRYGSGPLNAGLLKAPEAMDSPDAMVGLYMPKLPNKPISSYLSVDQVTPGYERRHYYVWAVEYRGRKYHYGSMTSPEIIEASLTGQFFW